MIARIRREENSREDSSSRDHRRGLRVIIESRSSNSRVIRPFLIPDTRAIDRLIGAPALFGRSSFAPFAKSVHVGNPRRDRPYRDDPPIAVRCPRDIPRSLLYSRITPIFFVSARNCRPRQMASPRLCSSSVTAINSSVNFRIDVRIGSSSRLVSLLHWGWQGSSSFDDKLGHQRARMRSPSSPHSNPGADFPSAWTSTMTVIRQLSWTASKALPLKIWSRYVLVPLSNCLWRKGVERRAGVKFRSLFPCKSEPLAR